ncbi:protein FLX-like 2 isoform X2 [Rhodamnia argentea]|uniref:Protein FLX-like 2 isoform X2 n=1 Tax=Rhodamnia argentea TaxID=178133 RepID=A0ABM3GVT6_9MYRT|nr:protein FLX-like 2 isoform X2 [Rhodamnia argentea]
MRNHNNLIKKMESKSRIPPPHLRRPIPGPGLVHTESFVSGIRRPPGSFSPVDMLPPPPEVMEQKLAAQHVEMQRLATENQRLANTHGALRQELAAAQHELQILHAQVGAVKSEREQQMRSLLDRIAKMEADIQAAEPLKLELQKARADAQKLIVARQELFAKVQQLTQDLQRAHADVQQLPALMSELEGLRQEYHHCRITFDYEKRLFDDHLQQLQVMEKNYVTMATEVEKLRAELSNASNVEGRAGPQGGPSVNAGSEVTGNSSAQTAHGDGYGVPQAGGPPPPNAAGNAGVNPPTAPIPPAGIPAYPGAPSRPAPPRPNYDATAAGYGAHRLPSYDPYRGPIYDPQKGGLGYDAQRGAGFDMQRGNYNNVYKAPGHEVPSGPSYDASKGPPYDVQSRGAAGQQHGPVPPVNNVPHASSTPPPRPGGASDAPPRGGNPAWK